MELEVTWGRSTRVWWALFWRCLVATIIVLIIASVFGFIVGFIISATGGTITSTINIILMSIGGIMGLVASFVPVKMILGKDFGEFRLALVKT